MNRLISLVLSVSLLAGCELVQPKVHVLVPANTSYEPILAWAMAEGMEGLIEPTPAPPEPTPNSLKDGDDCPKCEGGYRPGDGVVRPVCVSCGGDGIVNTGDPILLPQEISIVVGKMAVDSKDFIAEQLVSMQDAIVQLGKKVEEANKCKCGGDCQCKPCTCTDCDCTKKVEEPVVENIIPEPQYKEVVWYYIFKDNDYYFWYENERSFKNKSGVTVRVLSPLEIGRDTAVTICHGNHCLQHQIYKLTDKVEVTSGGPKLNNQLQNGKSRK